MRISVPSWVIPGTYAENLDFLADKEEVRGVELLFFIYDEETRELFLREEERIRAYADRFAFTAHLPDPLLPAHEELVERTADLVESWVAHPGLPESAPAVAATLSRWRSRYGDRFLLENVRPGRLEALRTRLPDFPLCLDTGHLLLSGDSPARWATEHGKLVREVHLHGLGDAPGRAAAEADDGRLPDHRVFATGGGWFADFLPFLSGFGGVVDIELFSWEEARTMIDRLKRSIA